MLINSVKLLDEHIVSEKGLPFGKQKFDAWQEVKVALNTNESAKPAHNISVMPLSCKGCVLVNTILCTTCIRNATTDWFTTA